MKINTIRVYVKKQCKTVYSITEKVAISFVKFSFSFLFSNEARRRMASEGPSSKKRKVLQPTIKCFMNSKQSGAGESETTPEGKPMMGRSRASARTKTNGVLKDQPPVSKAHI